MTKKKNFSTKKTKLDQTDVTPPLLLKTLQDYAQEIFTPIKRGECVSTIWLPMLGRRLRNKFIISYPQLFKEQIGDLDKYLLVYVEPLELTEQSNIGYIKLITKSILDSYSRIVKKGAPELFNEANFYDTSLTSYPQWLESLNRLINQITSEGKEIVLFLGEFDELEFASSVFYNNLKSVWVKVDGHLHFIFLLLTDVAKQQSITKFGELNELVLKNVLYIPLLGKDEIDYQIDYFSKQLRRPFSAEEKNLLVEVCGGHPYLLKSCSRLIALMNGHKIGISALREMLINHFEPRSAQTRPELLAGCLYPK